MDVRSRRARQTSPDRDKLSMQRHQHHHQPPPKLKPIRKVQVVYYLTRNGHLEHPHYMEVSHFATQPLRLKDVMERLIALRGKGMPSLYSWSCKRSYKNGYVWNDLTENDIIFPADGAEYVLKGSEILEEKLQQLNVSSRQLIHREPKEPFKTTPYEDQDYEDEFEEDEEKTSYTSSTTSHSRCSRGVSTDELDEPEPHKPQLTESTPTLLTRSPPSLSSILSQDKPTHRSTITPNNGTSKRFEDGDPVSTGSTSSRNSVLLQLISCGNLAVPKAKSNSNNVVRRSSSDLHRGVLCKRAVQVAEEDKDMISFMSENPRFGNLQAEEKEYFSGSIVESVSKDRVEPRPVLKKSNSYNEERSSKAAIMEEIKAEEDDEGDKRNNYGLKGKCIPRKKSSSSSSSKKIIRK